MSTTRRWQIGLIVLGIALLLVGAVVLLNDVSLNRYFGIATWLIGALIIHDGIIAPLVFVVTVLMRKFGSRVPAGVTAIIQGALVIGGIVTLIVLPEIVKKSLGTLSTSILPLNYGLNLVIFYGAIAVLTALAIGFYVALYAKRQKLRPPATHD